ncbi:MAG: DNA mismatch repair endonuclease MutL [Bacteroidales bacterium]
MPKIHRLPPDLANQIAAGEVVERPASAVKELVENALDAGARRITVTVEMGGKKSIRVEDDGIGMEPEDARLALERHATSKISTSEDLAAIRTMGFRGEALPAIASVSHLVLRSRASGTVSGTEIRVNGGIVASVVDVGMPEGTSVEVGDLFYNLPARRKFLKADAAESAQVSRTVTLLALAHPTIGFTLVSAGRTVIQCPPAAGLAERFYQLFGERQDLVEVNKETAGVRLYGYAAALAQEGPTRGAQNVFVNSRIVKDRTIAHAIIDAYSVSSVKERSPEVHLFIEMPPDRVDVNVHPTKAEVRFREQSLIHELVRRALGAALGAAPIPELQLSSPEGLGTQPFVQSLPQMFGAPLGVRPPGLSPAGFETSATETAARDELAATGAAHPAPAFNGPGASDSAVAAAADQIGRMVPLGQFRDTYIIAADEEGLAIIDQHVAHERVLFERTLQRLAAGRLESQRFLVPLVLSFEASARETLLTHASELDRLGFELEDFGGDTLRVNAAPALLGAEESGAALRAVAADLEGLEKGARVEEALRRIAATTACHAAVKANDRLTIEKMNHILDELRQTAYSTVCPHGRPVMLRLTRREIERNFRRI